MFDIDLFDNSSETIAQLKAMGRVVICYFSAGSYEDWRADASDIPVAARGLKMSGWNELWLDVRDAGVREVMVGRLDLAKTKGCDGVEPDNVDGYSNRTGFPLTFDDQLDYNKFLASAAHQRGLSIALKNDLDQVKDLEPFFDFAINEECLQWNECDMLSPFIAKGKAVFHTEYEGDATTVCAKTAPLQLSTLIKRLDLDAWYIACWE
ncbi:MAG: endo alpha-1,4 polygalactosaminidase [Deltaproteobacteria bacterium]|nr:endo alpha-1,4 polygalactosaminidase [Deltaproteobacteria bacterium]